MLQAMYLEATLGIIVINSKGDIVKANPFSESLFGYKKSELIGQNIEILLPHSLRGRHVSHREKYNKKPVPRTMGANLELFGLRKDNSKFPIKISLSHMDIDGERFSIAYTSDDTKTQVMLQDLRNAQRINEDISKVMEESLNEIYIFNADSLKFIQVNKGARQNIGYTLEEMLDLTPIDIKPNFSHIQFQKFVSPLKDDLDKKIVFETVHERKDKTTYPVEVDLQYSRLGGEPVYVAFITDISERKKYEERILKQSDELEQKVVDRTMELRQSESKLRVSLEKEKELGELKSRFVSMASHEFRTPLSSILSSANLIGRYEKTEEHEKRMKHVNRIESSVRNLTMILNDFLSLEKLESGMIRCNPIPIDLPDFTTQIIDEVSLSTNQDQKILYSHIGLNSINTDEHLLKNILINLLSNGIKYSPNGKDVKLNTKVENEILHIEVIDQGIGIPESENVHMFSRFFRANNATNIQGTGLGLTIVKRYLDIMNGKIWYKSKEGQGTTFFIDIPNITI